MNGTQRPDQFQLWPPGSTPEAIILGVLIATALGLAAEIALAAWTMLT